MHSRGAILYTPGKLPTRNGMPLYHAPFGDDKLLKEGNDPSDNGALASEDSSGDDLRPSEKTMEMLHKKFCRNQMLHTSRLSYPTPAEEHYRGEQIRILRQNCEDICCKKLKSYLPKDLLDQCIFVETGSRRWCKDDAKDREASVSYKDPIFPNCSPELMRKVLLRELFGDVIGRLIPKDKQGLVKKVIQAVASSLERSSEWLGLFYSFLRTQEGKVYVEEVHPSPLCVFGNNVAVSEVPHGSSWEWRASAASNTAAENDWSLPEFVPPCWVWWLERARGIIRDHSAELVRLVDLLEGKRVNSVQQHNTTVEEQLIARSNVILRNILTVMYPVVYIFVSQVADAISGAIRTYQTAMENYMEYPERGTSASSDFVRARCISSEGATRECSQSWEDEVVFQYRGDDVSCRRAHFEKYVRLFLWSLKDRDAEAYARETGVTITEDVLNATDPALWLTFRCVTDAQRVLVTERIYVMLKRYANVIYSPRHHTRGGNMHAAAPEKVFHYLKDTLHVTMECFASPNNCFFPRFFSAFPDTDMWFGSIGSFFDVLDFPPGAYEVGPPYTEEMLLFTVNHLEAILSRTDDRCALTFIIFVPDWFDCEGLKRMKASRWCTNILEGPGHQHLYVVGTQHSVGSSLTRYYRPPHATMCFILQNTAGRSASEITSAIQGHLQLRMQDRSEGDALSDARSTMGSANSSRLFGRKDMSTAGFWRHTKPPDWKAKENGVRANDTALNGPDSSQRCWWTLLTSDQAPIASLLGRQVTSQGVVGRRVKEGSRVTASRSAINECDRVDSWRRRDPPAETHSSSTLPVRGQDDLSWRRTRS